MPFSRPVVIVGCGRLGSHLAAQLHGRGVAVVVVDKEAGVFASLPERLAASSVAGEALQPGVLERIGIEDGICLIATTGEDWLNLAVSLVCRRLFGLRHVLARVRDPRRADSYALLGVETVCPTTLEASAFDWLIGAIQRGDGPGARLARGSATSLHIVVVGCGRSGSHLANILSRAGHGVVVVDRNPSTFETLTAEGFSGSRVEGDASEPVALRQAKPEQADLLIAATREDNVNLMVALVAKSVFGVKHVMMRAFDPRREQMYRELGLETVCPTLLAGAALLQIFDRALEDGGADR